MLADCSSESGAAPCVCVMRAEIYRASHAHFFNSLQIIIEIFSSFMDCNTVVHIEIYIYIYMRYSGFNILTITANHRFFSPPVTHLVLVLCLANEILSKADYAPPSWSDCSILSTGMARWCSFFHLVNKKKC